MMSMCSAAVSGLGSQRLLYHSVNKYSHVNLPGYQVLVQMGPQAAWVVVVEMVELEILTVVGTFPVGQAENTQFF